MNIWQPIKFWWTGPCVIHLLVGVFIHLCFCFNFFKRLISFALCLLVGSVGIVLYVLGSSNRILDFLIYSFLSITTDATSLSAFSIMWFCLIWPIWEPAILPFQVGLRRMGMSKYSVDVSSKCFCFCGLQSLTSQFNCCYVPP